jgi:endonuclease/exonuclease/phosphatase family metal-dependent hydrolase
VDVRVRRTGFVDQPAALATALGFHYAFAASIKWQGGDYGLAVLSRWPLADVERLRFDTPGVAERRIVLDVTVCADGRPLRVFNHHADFRSEPAQVGLAALAALVRPEVGRGVVVLGDFNNGPDTPGVHALLEAGLVDRGAAQNQHTSVEGRIDYLLLDGLLASRTSATQVWTTSSSDHHAVLTDLSW